MTMMTLRIPLVLALALVSRAPLAATDQWPRFRGTQAGLVADDPALPDTWSETENVVWKTDIPGLGWSSPVVWDDHVFITSAVSTGKEATPIPGLYDPGDDQGSVKSSSVNRWMVYDVDFATGKIRWATEMRSGAPPIARHIKNTYASETAVTDGERVYVHMGTLGVLAALDMKGQVAWVRELGVFKGSSEYGSASSPTLHNGRLYLVNDNTTQSFIAAFDARTGREIWRTNREEAQSWASPFVWENALRTEIVTASTNKVRSYDMDGRLLWELKGMTILSTPSPFSAHGLVYISSGYPADPLRPERAQPLPVAQRDAGTGLGAGGPGRYRRAARCAGLVRRAPVSRRDRGAAITGGRPDPGCLPQALRSGAPRPLWRSGSAPHP